MADQQHNSLDAFYRQMRSMLFGDSRGTDASQDPHHGTPRGMFRDIRQLLFGNHPLHDPHGGVSYLYGKARSMLSGDNIGALYRQMRGMLSGSSDGNQQGQQHSSLGAFYRELRGMIFGDNNPHKLPGVNTWPSSKSERHDDEHEALIDKRIAYLRSFGPNIPFFSDYAEGLASSTHRRRTHADYLEHRRRYEESLHQHSESQGTPRPADEPEHVRPPAPVGGPQPVSAPPTVGAPPVIQPPRILGGPQLLPNQKPPEPPGPPPRSVPLRHPHYPDEPAAPPAPPATPPPAAPPAPPATPPAPSTTPKDLFANPINPADGSGGPAEPPQTPPPEPPPTPPGDDGSGDEPPASPTNDSTPEPPPQPPASPKTKTPTSSPSSGSGSTVQPGSPAIPVASTPVSNYSGVLQDRLGGISSVTPGTGKKTGDNENLQRHLKELTDAVRELTREIKSMAQHGSTNGVKEKDVGTGPDPAKTMANPSANARDLGGSGMGTKLEVARLAGNLPKQ